MSIKIKQGSETKSVNDVIFGTSKTASKNVNKVVDWNGNVIWERASPKIDITGRLSYNTNPSSKDFYASGYEEFTYSYTGKKLGFYNVEYTGTEPPTYLYEGYDYEVSYVGDSGKIDHGSSYGEAHNNATATIKGIGDYTGKVDQAYTITHNNMETPPTPTTKYNFFLSMYSSTELVETTATKVSGFASLYESDSNTVTAKVKSTSEKYPRIKLNDTGIAYASPHTFTCKNDQGTGISNAVTFKFYSAENPTISSYVPWDTSSGTITPKERTSHKATYTRTTPVTEYSPCYANTGTTIRNDGFIITFDDGSSIVWTTSNTHGITIIARGYTNHYTIDRWDGSTTDYTYVTHNYFQASADGTEYKGTNVEYHWYGPHKG